MYETSRKVTRSQNGKHETDISITAQEAIFATYICRAYVRKTNDDFP